LSEFQIRTIENNAAEAILILLNSSVYRDSVDQFGPLQNEGYFLEGLLVNKIRIKLKSLGDFDSRINLSSGGTYNFPSFTLEIDERFTISSADNNDVRQVNFSSKVLKYKASDLTLINNSYNSLVNRVNDGFIKVRTDEFQAFSSLLRQFDNIGNAVNIRTYFN
jgi:hypothetical protein